jgi:hypothetical protein
MTEERESIIRKLRAILAQTVENGCTEEEAMAAAARASVLMEKYALSFDDVAELRDERYGARRRQFGGGTHRRRSYHEVWNLVGAIAAFCDCKVWRSANELVYFGTEHDTLLAHQLTDLIRVTMDQEFARYLKSDERDWDFHPKTLRANFLLGMIRRVNQRLFVLIEQRREQIKKTAQEQGKVTATGNALVLVAKNEIVEERYNKFLDDTGLKMSHKSRKLWSRSENAYTAGRAAGDRVALDPQLGGEKKRIAS